METELNAKHIEKTVSEIRLADIFKGRIIQYNGIKGMAPFGAVGETLGTGVVFLPKVRKIFRATGMCFSLDEIQHKIYESNLFYRDLITKEVRRKIPWLYDIRKKNADIYKSFLNFRVNVDLNNFFPEFGTIMPEDLENFKIDVIKYRNLYLPNNFCDIHTNIREDAIEPIAGRFVEYKFFSGMTSYEIGVWLKQQIANINIVALYLNPETVDENYLQLFLRSRSGYVFLQEWQGRCVNGDVLSTVNKMTILLPDLQNQKMIGRAYAECLEKQKMIKDDMLELSELINESMYKTLKEWATCDFLFLGS